MARFLIRRVLQAIVVLIGSVTVVFILIRLSGDPAELMLGINAAPEDLARFRYNLGLDKPLPVQYVEFLSNILKGDWGGSIAQSGQPAMGLVMERLPKTAELGLAALLISLALAIPLGIGAAIQRGQLFDRVVVAIAALGQSLPPFWLGLLFIMLFSVRLRWFPSYGSGTIRHLILPSFTLALHFMGKTTRLMRSSMLEVLGKDYLRTAYAKGLPKRLVLFRHAFKNAALALVTVAGIDLSALMGGAVITETVFAWPGIGRLAIQSVFDRDYPVVQAAVFLTAVFVMITNVMVDIVYLYVDPRIRYT